MCNNCMYAVGVSERPEPSTVMGYLHQRAPEDPLEAVSWLAQVRAEVGTALDEAMATAAISGASHRAVAEAAGVAPNTVPARLARTALAAYAESNRVSSGAVVRARYDHEQGRPAPARTQSPLRFRRRTPPGGTA